MKVLLFVAFAMVLAMISITTIAQSNWTIQNSGVSLRLVTIKAVSPAIGWVGGENGTVLCTTDSGNTWNSVGGGTIGTGTIYSVDAVNDSIALVTTTPSSTTYIFRTSDEGTNWKQVFSLEGSFINGIWMLDDLNGIAVGDPVGDKFVVLKTTDSGLSWTHFSNEPNANANEYGLVESLCVRDNYIWFGTVALGIGLGRVVFSTDFGVNWDAGTTPLTDVQSVWFNDPLVGIVAGRNADTELGIAKSIDGGYTWESIAGNFGRVVGDGYEKYFGLGDIEGNPYGIYESPGTSFNWNNVFIYDGGGASLEDISVGKYGVVNFGWTVSTSGTIVRYFEPITNVEDAQIVVTYFSLYQNYPNPFNPVTTIAYQIREISNVNLKVYDILGREVATLVNEEKLTGNYEVKFDGSNLSSGVYLYRMEAGSFMDTKKLLLMK